MKKKFKGEVYRAAIEKLDYSLGFACCALDKVTKRSSGYSKRFSDFLKGKNYPVTWTLTCNTETGKTEQEYAARTELGRRTREIALELAAHLEDIGEMDRILKGK